MGWSHEDGYSAEVEGFLVVGEQRIRVAKTNERRIVLAEPCELDAGTQADLLVLVDGNEYSQRVALLSAVAIGQTSVDYRVLAPF